MEGFSEEGMFWGVTREELERCKKYKKQKALRFVQEGYSVEWYPNGDCFIGVYTPERAYANQPEIKADVKFAKVAANIARKPSSLNQTLFSGTNTPIPPI